MIPGTEYSEKAIHPKKRNKRTQTLVRKLRVPAGAHAYSTIERRASAFDKDQNETKTYITNVTPEKDNAPSARRTQVSSRHLWLIHYYGERTSTSTLALGWAILSFVRAYY